jgi:hypothetical protein
MGRDYRAPNINGVLARAVNNDSVSKLEGLNGQIPYDCSI